MRPSRIIYIGKLFEVRFGSTCATRLCSDESACPQIAAATKAFSRCGCAPQAELGALPGSGPPQDGSRPDRRTLAMPESIKDWSMTALTNKLIKVGAKV